jgi:hypothetical protein
MVHKENEYQIKIINEDGTVELSEWMNGTDQVVETMAAVPSSQGKFYWLLVRREEQIIQECPIRNIPSPRYSPHDSHYLVRARFRDRYTSGF